MTPDQLLGRERYAFGDPNYDAGKKFPDVVKRLTDRYPDYGLVYDRQKGRWLIYRRLGPEKALAIMHIENSDMTYADPSHAAIDYLIACDWTRLYKNVDDAIAAIERADEEQEAKEDFDLDEYFRLERQHFKRFIERAPDRVFVKGLMPIDRGHARQLHKDLNLSMAASAAGGTTA